MTIRDIAISFGYQIDKASEKKANDSIQSLKATATKLLGAIGIGFSLVKLKDIAEEFNGINDQIRDATQGMGDQAEIQQAILKTANETRQSYGDMADSIGKMVRNADVFSGVEDAAGFAGLMYKNFMATGKSAAESNALVQQMTTAISKGAVDSRAMMAMFKESPGTLRMMADSLGVSIETLQDMVSKGQVSAKTLKNVFEQNAGGIEARFAGLDYSISDALLNVRNQWGLFVDEMNSTLGITETIAKVIVSGFNQVMKVLRRMQDGFMKLANKIGGVQKLMKLLTIAAGAVFAALNAGKILTFIKAVATGLTQVNVKMLAAVTVIIILALLIEDLINFMSGNDSLMGELFDKFGVDGDAVRQTIQDILDTAKGLLPVILDFAKIIGGKLLDGIKQLLPHIIDFAKDVLPEIIDLVKKIIGVLINVASKIFPDILSAIEKILPVLIDFISDILPVIIDLILELIPIITDIIDEILPVIIDLIKELIPVILEIISSILPVIITLIKQLLPVILKVIKTVLPALTSLIKKLIPLAMDIIKKILPVVIKLIEKLIPVITTVIEDILPVIISLIEKLLPIILDVIDAVLPMVISLIDTLIESIMPIVDEILPLLTTLLDTLTPIIEFVADVITNRLEAAFEGIVPIIKSVMGYLRGLIKFITGIFTGNWEKAWEGVKEIFTSQIEGLAAAFRLPINIIIAGLNTFIDGINGIEIPDWVPGVGGMSLNIPNIPNIPKLGDDSIASSSASAAASSDDSSSYRSNKFPEKKSKSEPKEKKSWAAPSKKESDTAKIAEAKDMYQTLKDIANMAVKPKPEAAAAFTSAVENKSITQNIEIQNQFLSDRAAQEKSAEAMDKAADDATGQLARALAYVR